MQIRRFDAPEPEAGLITERDVEHGLPRGPIARPTLWSRSPRAWTSRTARTSLDAAKCLKALAPHLPGDLLDRAVQVAAATTDSVARRTALEGLAPHLHGTRAKAAFKAALTIADDPERRASAAIAVAPMLDDQDRDQALGAALEAVLAVDALWARAYALARLVPFLRGDAKSTAREEGLQTALSLGNRRGHIESATPLAALVPELEGETLRTALLGLLNVEDIKERARVFKECHLPAQGPGVATVQLVLADQLLASRKLQRADLLRILTLRFFAPPFLPSGGPGPLPGPLLRSAGTGAGNRTGTPTPSGIVPGTADVPGTSGSQHGRAAGAESLICAVWHSALREVRIALIGGGARLI